MVQIVHFTFDVLFEMDGWLRVTRYQRLILFDILMGLLIDFNENISTVAGRN